ncbi:MAG: hypothetical protein ACOVQE_04400 [Chitinophagaceae bacterium]
MRKISLLLVIAVVLSVSCNKDAYTSKPQLKFKEISATNIVLNSIFNISVEFTDKEGDIQDTLYIQKISKSCPGINSEFKTAFQVPSFTPVRNLKGNFEIQCVYNAAVPGYLLLKGCSNRDDSTYLRFWLKDKAGNISDTINSPTFVLLRP